MVKAPRAGSVKTRLCPPLSSSDAALLAGAFLSDTLRTAHAPVLRADVTLALAGDVRDLSSPPAPETRIVPQTGNSLEERLVDIVADTFAVGYRWVCVIGGDAPHLPPAFFVEAFGRLAHGADAVLGPADDGGYYLIALPRPAPELLRNIPWSGPDVLSATLARAAEAALSVSLLPPWYDIDTPDELRRLRTDLRRGVVDAPATARALEKVTS